MHLGQGKWGRAIGAWGLAMGCGHWTGARGQCNKPQLASRLLHSLLLQICCAVPPCRRSRDICAVWPYRLCDTRVDHVESFPIISNHFKTSRTDVQLQHASRGVPAGAACTETAEAGFYIAARSWQLAPCLPYVWR